MRTVTITIKLKDGMMITDKVDIRFINIKNIEKQFDKNRDVIIFGNIGVRRELINYYTICITPTVFK